MKTGFKNRIWAVAFGVLAMLILSLVLSAIAAALISAEILPVGAENGVCWGIAGLVSFLGALVCARRAGEKRLPLCMASGVVYLLLAFVLRGLFFKEVGPQPWVVPVLTVAGCVLGALASSGKKKRRY